MSRCWKDISLEECEVPLSSVERKRQNIIKGEISRTRRVENSVNKSEMEMKANLPVVMAMTTARTKALLEKLVELEEAGKSKFDAEKDEEHDNSHCEGVLSKKTKLWRCRVRSRNAASWQRQICSPPFFTFCSAPLLL